MILRSTSSRYCLSEVLSRSWTFSLRSARYVSNWFRASWCAFPVLDSAEVEVTDSVSETSESSFCCRFCLLCWSRFCRLSRCRSVSALRGSITSLMWSSGLRRWLLLTVRYSVFLIGVHFPEAGALGNVLVLLYRMR
jgi:hypothetical protein